MTATPNRKKLTHMLVWKALPATQACLIWDTVQRGLALRVETDAWVCD